MEPLRLVIVTGLSGAGKTQAIKALEDLGFFCIDNLPPQLLPKLVELCLESEGRIQRLAVVVDVRGGEFFHELTGALERVEGREEVSAQILFLEADDEELVRRHKETRRRHPLAPHLTIAEAIHQERKLLEEIRGRATRILDTSQLSPQRLREEVMQVFSGDPDRRLVITVITFGFKHGLPLDADLVLDVRFLPNPFYVESLTDLGGDDPRVAEYVLKWPVTRQFLRRLYSLICFLIPHYQAEGKTQLVIGIGCTGGCHRSVVIGDQLARLLREKKHTVLVEHRDLTRTYRRQNP
ncbi:MAG: RNase adapter RapZ [Bacillota bacterium]